MPFAAAALLMILVIMMLPLGLHAGGEASVGGDAAVATSDIF